MFGNLLRRAAATATALGVSSGVVLTATPAQATDTYTFVPIRLTVYDIEDWWDTHDEPRMYYGGAVWADSVQKGGYPGVIPPVNFSGTMMSVDLWERDGGWTDNNHLGWATVTNDQLNQEKTLRFKSAGNYDYEIAYKIVEAG